MASTDLFWAKRKRKSRQKCRVLLRFSVSGITREHCTETETFRSSRVSEEKECNIKRNMVYFAGEAAAADADGTAAGRKKEMRT